MSETTFEHPAMVLELRGYALFQLVSEDAEMGSRWVLRVPDVRDLLPRAPTPNARVAEAAPPPDVTALVAKWCERRREREKYASAHAGSPWIYGEAMCEARGIKSCADELEAWAMAQRGEETPRLLLPRVLMRLKGEREAQYARAERAEAALAELRDDFRISERECQAALRTLREQIEQLPRWDVHPTWGLEQADDGRCIVRAAVLRLLPDIKETV